MNILVSACLLGVKCRYDGGSSFNLPLVEIAEKNCEIHLVPVCPEVLGGLPTPRVPCEKVGDRVVGKDGKDYTEQFEKGAAEALNLAKKNSCRYAILKERSPSCGFGQINDGSFTGRRVDGSGVTAALLTRNGVEVMGESRAEAFFVSL